MFPLLLIFLFIIGAAIGSFISVLVYRLHHEHKGIVLGRSACPACQKILTPLDLIPIASYLTLRGKCRYCRNPISFMYPLLELVTGLIFVLLFLKFPFIDAALRISETMLGLYLLYAFYSFILIFTFFFDLRYLQVADEVLLPAILVGLVATIAAPATPYIIDALLGAAIPLAFFGLQIAISNGKWLGRGDLRVGALMGVILGWKLTLVALFLSYMVGSLVAIIILIRKKKISGMKVPFAPFLVTGTFLAMFYGEKLLDWYLG